tara:strand:- start:38 stop:514 length:477 start_codon:yes stop_codon:yes gene_type:complete
MKFTNITLASGKSAAEPEQGLKRLEGYYVTGSSYGIGTAASDTTVNTDYYVVWNEWPTLSGNNANASNDVQFSALSSIGIDTLTTRGKNGTLLTKESQGLDCVIIRREDRKAVRIQITGQTSADYRTAVFANATITEVDPIDGPWTPELARLTTLGYL